MVIAGHEKLSCKEPIELEESKKGAGGFGHTGEKQIGIIV